MAEAKGVVVGDHSAVGSDQLLAYERREVRLDVGFGRELRDGRAVEDLALDGAPLDHRSLV